MRQTENGTDGYPRKRAKRIDEKGAKIWQKEEKSKKFAKSVERRSVFRYNKEKRRAILPSVRREGIRLVAALRGVGCSFCTPFALRRFGVQLVFLLEKPAVL